MRQCLLVNYTITAQPRHKTAWIPAALAKHGKYLTIKEIDGWVDHWKVEKVYGFSETVHEQRDYFAGGVGAP
jgi:hypothetical protein